MEKYTLALKIIPLSMKFITKITARVKILDPRLNTGTLYYINGSQLAKMKKSIPDMSLP